VHNAALSWQQAGILTAVLAAAAVVLTLGMLPRLAPLAPFTREATLVSGLYTAWQLAGTLSVLGTSGALARADWIEHAERTWHLPSEAALQAAFTGHPLLIEAANVYYATMHFGVLFVFLLWLFLRHRERYPAIRRVLALTTLVCLAIQLLPVAPPRFLPGYGYVDTAERYGQSVYSLGFGADQLSAMPSVHVAWAVLVAWTVFRLVSGPARLVGAAHAVLTLLVVVITANHFWADGIVAVAVLALCAAFEDVASRVVRRVREEADASATPAKVATGS